ncbi:MAG: envelope stress response membrane protein PspB [Sandaracinobacter sp.]|jgi:phage shock protein B
MEFYEAAIPLTAVLSIFVGLPWLFLHYMTKWKQAKTITLEDENLLDELHDIARRLDDRMNSIERIIAADRGEPARITDLRNELNNVELHPQMQRRDRAI